ncbi:hypothetical protein M3P05_16340 [Sansalvadorimonas sp. 2012CJ34-2]|uniref:Uncharacterized protein n=1 Tax=Parendozoicomonas callyspongiae TaxID=2942213 RepID=A0ABT0PJB8_9GAMM|nr:hypothetical protein [Sansalvadorimonas sp. 2012CJ34-2]MCL6271490.1 hypothetical protein [Sansalvadorimonas sp. 2012CJ34-2]
MPARQIYLTRAVTLTLIFLSQLLFIRPAACSDIKFSKRYQIFGMVSGEKISAGFIHRHDVEVDENYIAASHYHSKLDIQIRCNNDNTMAICHELRNKSSGIKKAAVNQFNYCFDAFSPGIGYRYSTAIKPNRFTEGFFLQAWGTIKESG